MIVSFDILELWVCLEVRIEKADRAHIGGQTNFLQNFICVWVLHNLGLTRIKFLSVQLRHYAYLEVSIDSAFYLLKGHVFRLILKRLSLLNFRCKNVRKLIVKRSFGYILQQTAIYRINIIFHGEPLCKLPHLADKALVLHSDGSALFEAVECRVAELDLGVVILVDFDLAVADLVKQVLVRLDVLHILGDLVWVLSAN